MNGLPGKYLSVRVALRISQIPRVTGEALEVLFIFCLSLLSYLIFRLTGVGLNNRN